MKIHLHRDHETDLTCLKIKDTPPPLLLLPLNMVAPYYPSHPLNGFSFVPSLGPPAKGGGGYA